LPKVVTQRCLEQDLNPRPTDHKSNALPVAPPRGLVTDKLKARNGGAGVGDAGSTRLASGTCLDDRLAVEDAQREHVRAVDVDALRPRRPVGPSATLHHRRDDRLHRHDVACRPNTRPRRTAFLSDVASHQDCCVHELRTRGSDLLYAYAIR